jgi:hypothetical protein
MAARRQRSKITELAVMIKARVRIDDAETTHHRGWADYRSGHRHAALAHAREP